VLPPIMLRRGLGRSRLESQPSGKPLPSDRSCPSSRQQQQPSGSLRDTSRRRRQTCRSSAAQQQQLGQGPHSSRSRQQ
jgi:hypothetical protein